MGLKDWTKKLFPNEYDVDEYTDEDYTEPEEAPVRDDVRPRDNKPTPGGYPAPASNGVQLASRASSSSIEMQVVRDCTAIDRIPFGRCLCIGRRRTESCR